MEKELQKKRTIENVILTKGILEEKKLGVAFFYFNCINIPKAHKKRNEEWKKISEGIIKQRIVLEYETQKATIIQIYYTLEKFHETSREFILTSEKRYARQIDIVLVGKEGTTSTSRYYQQEDYKCQIIQEDLRERAKKDVLWENHWQQRKYSMEWGTFKNWIPQQLDQLSEQDKEFKIGSADLFVKTKVVLVSRKKVVQYTINGLCITVYLPVWQYEIEISLFHEPKEVLVRKKYSFLFFSQRKQSQ